MAEDTFARLFKRMDSMQEHLTRIEVLLDENLLVWKQEVTQHIEKHNERIAALENAERDRKIRSGTYVSMGMLLKSLLAAVATTATIVYTLMQICG